VLNTELTPDGDVLTEHVLAHDHANEQPFTRIREPFDIPDEVGEITVEGRDRANGYTGGTVTVPVPRKRRDRAGTAAATPLEEVRPRAGHEGTGGRIGVPAGQ